MRIPALIALFTLAACKGDPVTPTDGDADTDTDADSDADTDADADADCAAEDSDLGHALGAALITGTTCGAGDDFFPTCGGGEDLSYAWMAPYAGDFDFNVGMAGTASVAVSETCPAEDELSCGAPTTTVTLRSQDQVLITVDGDSSGSCGDFSLDIQGHQDFSVVDVSGTVTDANGSPVAGAQIRFCASVCLNSETDANGAWSVRGAERTNTSLEVLQPGGSTAVSFAAVQIGPTEEPTYAMSLLSLGAESPLTATVEWHDLTDGLRVQVSGPEIETPVFFPHATGVAGVLVPEAQWPPLHGLTDVIAVWYTAPFDYEIPAGAPIEIDNAWSLPDGNNYRVWTGDYTSRSWIDVGTLTANSATLTGSAEIGHFSTIVLTGPVTP